MTIEVSAGGGIKWYSFNEGLLIAKKQNKFMLVDFYTDWCGWCKKMDAETYKNSEIVDYITKNFIAVKLNPEKDSAVDFQGKNYPAAQFAQAAGVNGYPATGFFDYNGDFLGTLPGYMDSGKFMNLLKYIVNKEYEKEQK
ncbi:MAG: hypothetical protein A2V66_11020 [Ignavibacteria bacterium RBG_13_36_8]|nr:MAG: hypothetical protein A2V66_11020 [Ignavibacteria bacterium RBG_13_36_8]